MWKIAPILIAILAVGILLLLRGTTVKVRSSGMKLGFRTYTNEDIMCHRFSVKVCNKSPAEYASAHNVHIPWMGAPHSHRPKWIVELDVFDRNGQYICKHLMQQPNERRAEKLAVELKRCLASQLNSETEK